MISDTLASMDVSKELNVSGMPFTGKTPQGSRPGSDDVMIEVATTSA